MGKLLQAFIGNKITSFAGIGIILTQVGLLLQGEPANLEMLGMALMGLLGIGARDGGTGSDAAKS